MTQKTENLTTEEAWAAMARGECVKCRDRIRRIDAASQSFQVWQEDFDCWQVSTTLGLGPYSIVPDPSKPKEVEDEYNKSRQDILTQEAVADLFAESILIHMDRFFVRKP